MHLLSTPAQARARDFFGQCRIAQVKAVDHDGAVDVARRVHDIRAFHGVLVLGDIHVSQELPEVRQQALGLFQVGAHVDYAVHVGIGLDSRVAVGEADIGGVAGREQVIENPARRCISRVSGSRSVGRHFKGFPPTKATSRGAARVALSWRSKSARNSVQFVFADEEGEIRKMVEVDGTDVYAGAVFPLGERIRGNKTLSLSFLPGSNIDLAWFQFQE
jgi:hypothetical protein